MTIANISKVLGFIVDKQLNVRGLLATLGGQGKNNSDFGFSGMAAVPIEEVTTRNEVFYIDKVTVDHRGYVNGDTRRTRAFELYTMDGQHLSAEDLEITFTKRLMVGEKTVGYEISTPYTGKMQVDMEKLYNLYKIIGIKGYIVGKLQNGGYTLSINSKGPYCNCSVDYIPKVDISKKNIWKHWCNGVVYSRKDSILYIKGNGTLSMFAGSTKEFREILNGVQKIAICKGITAIEDDVFSAKFHLNDRGIKEVSLPDTLNRIGRGVFEGNKGLVTVKMPEEMPRGSVIPERLFRDCYSLENVTIPLGVSKIERCAFYACNKIKSIELPYTVTRVCNKAFSNCTSLAEVTFSKQIASIDTLAFADCSSLKEVDIQTKDYVSIGEMAFTDCFKLEKVKITTDTVDIKNWAFRNCSSLAEVNIPTTNVNVAKGAFMNCCNVGKVNIGKMKRLKDKHLIKAFRLLGFIR